MEQEPASPQEESIAEARVTAAQLASSLIGGDSPLLQAHFAANGLPEPDVIWSPERDDLRSPILQSYADICDELAGADGFLSAGELRLSDFDGLERWMMVLSRDGETYRYDHYGSEVASNYGVDMTGRRMSDFDNFIAIFFQALYAASRARRERVLSIHEPPAKVFVRHWRRLIVPIADAQGVITGFSVANVPENELRAGLEMIVDPVFVTDSAGEVQYCNDAARSFFGITGVIDQAMGALTGLETDGLPPPELLLARREIVERLDLIERRGGVMERLAVSVSAAEHRGRAYYVFLLRTLAQS